MLNVMLIPCKDETLGIACSERDPKNWKIRMSTRCSCCPEARMQSGESAGTEMLSNIWTAMPDTPDGKYFKCTAERSDGVRNVAAFPACWVMRYHVKLRPGKRYAHTERGRSGKTPDDTEQDLVLCRPGGVPMNAKADWRAWPGLRSAGEGAARAHPRQPAHGGDDHALVRSPSLRVVMEFLTWLQMSLLQRFQHVFNKMRQDTADKLSW